MSLLRKIAGTVSAEKIASIPGATDPDVLHHLRSSPRVLQALDLVRQERPAPEKVASFDVVQIRPDGYGYLVKFSAAPQGMAPQEMQMAPQQAQQAFPPEALQVADQQGAATLTGVEAPAPDPLMETPEPIMKPGIYKVFEMASGKQFIGFVSPGMFNPMMGGMVPTSFFTNGNQFAISPEPFLGVSLGTAATLPSTTIVRGKGVFFKTEGTSVMATVPYTIAGEITTPEGETYYSATDENGLEVQLSILPNMKRPIAAGPTPSGINRIIIPDSFSFMALDNPIQIANSQVPPEQVMAPAKMASADSQIIIAGLSSKVRLSGAAVEKVASGEHSVADALFYMAATGIPQNVGVELIEYSRRAGRPVELFGVSPLSSADDEAEKVAQVDRVMSALWSPPDVQISLVDILALEKVADAIGAQTVDDTLALNFINKENVASFLEHLPKLDEAASRLAELSFAVDMGLPGVSGSTVSRAMVGLETVIDSLSALKEINI
jgi:hypothetical protein